MKKTIKLENNFNEREFFNTILAGFHIDEYYNKYKSVIPEEFMHKYAENLPFYVIIQYQEIPEKFIENHIKYFALSICADYQQFSENFLELFADLIGWEKISKCQFMTEKFMLKHVSVINWDKACKLNNELPLSVLKAADEKDLLNWEIVSKTQLLSEESIEMFKDKIHFGLLDEGLNLSREFMLKHVDKLGIDMLVCNYVVDEDMLIKHAHNINDWEAVVRCQNLSENFMRKFKNDISWYYVSTEYSNLSEEFMLEFADKLYWKFLYENVESRVSSEFKDKLIKIMSKK